jgi:hypothetical protein
LQKVGGPAIKTTFHWSPWLSTLKPDQSQRAQREVQIATFAMARPRFHQDFVDYREVAPGWWMPFRQSMQSYDLDAPERPIYDQNELTVTEVAVNQPIDAELFRIEIPDGARVSTDWRYDPPIGYIYRRYQTEAERIALCAAAKKERAKEEEERHAHIKSQMGKAPPQLPVTGWLNGGPMTWEQLQGNEVTILFLDANNKRFELPYYAFWYSANRKIPVVGIHPPTHNIESVRDKLDESGVTFPVLIDTPPIESGKIGVFHDWFGKSDWVHTVYLNERGLVSAYGVLQLYPGPVGIRRYPDVRKSATTP